MEWSILIIDIAPFVKNTVEIQNERNLCKYVCLKNGINFLSLYDWVYNSEALDAYFIPSLKCGLKDKLAAAEKLVEYMSLKSGLNLSKGGVVVHRNYRFDLINYFSSNWFAGIEKCITLKDMNLIYSMICELAAAEKNEKYGIQLLHRNEVEWFNCEGKKVLNNVRRGISLIKAHGYEAVLYELIVEMQNSKIELSRLLITREKKIYLLDWDMREVSMTPLARTVYMLFLRYPDGMNFKELCEYEDELKSIYISISNRINDDIINSSIKSIVNPFNNSINEKCSQIKRAFIKAVSMHLAKNYYIQGDKGEKKKVLIDRRLVVEE